MSSTNIMSHVCAQFTLLSLSAITILIFIIISTEIIKSITMVN